MRTSAILAAIVLAGCATSGGPAPDNSDALEAIPTHILACDYTLDGIALDCDAPLAETPTTKDPPPGWSCVWASDLSSFDTYWHDDGRVGLLFTPQGWQADTRVWGRLSIEDGGEGYESTQKFDEAWFTTTHGQFFVGFDHVAAAGDRGLVGIGMHPFGNVSGNVPEATTARLQVLALEVGDRVAPMLKVPSDAPRYYLSEMFRSDDEPSLGWSHLNITRNGETEFVFQGGNTKGRADWVIPEDIALQRLLGDPCA